MQIQEFKNKAKVIFKNNLSKFIQVILLHALLLSIVPLHIAIIIVTSSSLDGGSFWIIVALFSFLPILCFIIPNLNPCIIRSFRGTIYEVRNNPTIKSYKYITNIFKHYGKYFSIAFLTNTLWYILMILLFIAFSFSFAFVGPLLNQNSTINQVMIVLAVYSPVIIAYIAKNIYNLNYCFSTYVIHDNPQIKVKDALKQSKGLLKGNFKDLLCLKFNYVGWYLLLIAIYVVFCNINIPILAIIVFFAGFELVNAYQTLAIIEMYNEFKSKKINLNNQFNPNNQIYSNNQNYQNYQNYINNSNYQNNQNYINNSNNQSNNNF